MNTQTKNTLLVAFISTLIGIGVGYFASESSNPEHNRHRNEHSSNQMMVMDEKMTGEKQTEPAMSHDMHNMSVKSEREFLEHMIPHHEEAVATARQVLARGATTPDIKHLTEAIVDAQEQEIADMKAWYLSWYGEEYKETGIYVPMMRDLSLLSGTELDRTFLEDMIAHHVGAVMMAQSVTLHLEHAEINELAKAIIETQSAEIELMNRFLETL